MDDGCFGMIPFALQRAFTLEIGIDVSRLQVLMPTDVEAHNQQNNSIHLRGATWSSNLSSHLLYIRLVDNACKEGLFSLRVRPFPQTYHLGVVVVTLCWCWSTQRYDEQGIWGDVHRDHTVGVWVKNALDWDAGCCVPDNQHTVLSGIRCHHPFLVLADSDGADAIAMPLKR